MEWYSIYFYVSTLLLSVYLFFKWKFTYWKNRKVPTLTPHIPFGNLRRNDPRHVKDLIGEVYNAFKKESPVAGLYMTFSPIAVLTDLDTIKSVLIQNFNQFHSRDFYYNEKDDPLSAHMFSASGDKWRRLRHKLSPTFTSGKMKYMFPTVIGVADCFVEALKDAIKNGPEIEMKEYLARFTTDVIGCCAFGIKCNSLKDPNAEFQDYGRKVFTDPRNSRFKTSLIRQFPDLAKKLHTKVIRDDVTKFFLTVVAETVAYREEHNIKRNDFMDLLIELKNSPEGLSIEEVAAQAFLFFLAGFETSSITLSYTLFELGLHQDIQDKAREEVRNIIENHNGHLTYEAIMEMKYVEQIINETLRKYPPVPVLTRCADNDFKVPDSKIVLEKGTRVFIPVYSIQHDPEVYDDPEKFDPDRFDSVEEAKRHPMSFLPFGDGPRNCIGLRFGMMQSRIGLITLLQNFRISPSMKTKLPLVLNKDSSLLATKDGMYLTLQKL